MTQQLPNMRPLPDLQSPDVKSSGAQSSSVANEVTGTLPATILLPNAGAPTTGEGTSGAECTDAIRSTALVAFAAHVPVVLLCGVGPVAHAVALLAAQAHFAVDIVDTDPELVAEEHFPMARQRFALPDFEDLAQHCSIGAQHYIAILTAQSHHSEQILSQALHTRAHYIGLSGSREQRAPLFASLREQGIPNTELACIRCPIGLAIGAQSSQEKAIAIVAELIAAREGCLPRAPKAE